MALNNDFYLDIFKKEEYWTNLANKGLLNVYYLKFEVRNFYLIKKQEIQNQFDETGNTIIHNVLMVIDNILNKIEEMITSQIEGKNIQISELTNIFLSNQMNNNVNNKENNKNLIEKKKEILNQIKYSYTNNNFVNNVDYVDDDFYYEDKVK